MAYQTWEQLTQELAARLPRLTNGDTIRLADEPYFSMLEQAPDFLRLETASSHTLPPDRRLTAEQEQQLRALGWEQPDVCRVIRTSRSSWTGRSPARRRCAARG